MLDWLIIGGGVHGTHLSNVLMHRLGVETDRIKVLDDGDKPLDNWERCARNVGMSYLRSPAVHHIGLEPMGLLKFARRKRQWIGSFRPPYDRPSLELFMAYSRHVCERRGLNKIRAQGKVEMLRRQPHGYRVESDQGVIEARRVVVATGMGDCLNIPEWARHDGELPIWHVLDERYEPSLLRDYERIGVVGLGISAGQLVDALIERGKRVELYGPENIEVADFDSAPCWLGPKCQVGFRRLASPLLKRKAIDKARQRGTMPRDVARRLSTRLAWGQVEHIPGWVEDARWESGEVEVHMEGGEQRRVDALVLATGFGPVEARQTWMEPTIETLGLKCSSCGAPLIDEQLQWAPGLHVSGAWAELQLGPAAPNIAGSRMAGRRILKSAS